MQVYVLTRCAGLLMDLTSRILNSGRTDVYEAVEKNLTLIEAFSTLAVSVAMSAGLNQERPYVDRKVIEIGLMYGKEMEGNFLATGNALEGVVAQDLVFCGELARG